MTGALPDDIGFAGFGAWRADASLWRPVVRDIAMSEALPHEAIEAFSSGTNLVVALDASIVLKLFPPMLRHQFLSERAALAALHGRIGVAIPEIVAQGARGHWSYLAMTRLPGISGKEAWPLLDETQKLFLLA